MATKRKTPLLRFRGFSEEWEKHKLKDIINYIVDNRGKNPAYYCDFGIPVIDNFMIGDTYPDLEKANRYIDEELFNNFIRKYNQPDDILITLVGNGIGKVSLFPDKKAVIIQNTLGLRSESNDKKFCYYTLLSKQDDVVALDRGMAQPSIRQDELLDLEIYTTSDFEEKKISAFVFTIDNLISLQKKKYKKLVATKRALFEKMFPKNGGDAAPLRFKGYESAWQKKILGKIGTTYTGLSGKTKDDFGHGEARFVTYVNVFKNPIADIKGVDFVEIDSSQNIVKSGDVLFTTSSETPEEVGMSSVWLGDTENTYLNSFCFGYRLFSSGKIDPLYLAYLLRSPEIRKEFQFLAQGISRYNISKTKVMYIVISVPEDYEEQVKIGKLFFNLDKLIELTQKKYEKLESLKKAMLNKMFV